VPYTDLDSVHVPSAGNRPPASWGTTVNANFDQVYDDVLAKLGIWTAYTPVLTQSGAVTKTVTYARYFKLGRLVTVSMVLAVTATGGGVSNNTITVSLPFTAVQAANMTVGTGHIYNASGGGAASHPARMVLNTTTTAAFQATYNTAGGFLGGTTFTEVLVNTDSIDCTFTYESTT